MRKTQFSRSHVIILGGNRNNHGVMGVEFFGLQVDHETQGDPAMLSVLPWDAQKVWQQACGGHFCEPGQPGVMGLDFFGLQVDHRTQGDPAMLSVSL